MYVCMYVCKVCIKHSCNENKGNSYQLEKLCIMKQILLISTFGNV